MGDRLTHAIENRLDHPAINLFPIPMSFNLLQDRRDQAVVAVLGHSQEEMLLPLHQCQLRVCTISNQSEILKLYKRLSELTV
jgi:hypothetical protein